MSPPSLNPEFRHQQHKHSQPHSTADTILRLSPMMRSPLAAIYRSKDFDSHHLAFALPSATMAAASPLLRHTELNYADKHLKDVGVVAVINALINSNSAVNDDIDSSIVGNAAISRYTLINFSGNSITDIGTSSLCLLLQQQQLFTSLHTLNLSWNSLYVNDSISQLCLSLRRLSSLKHLEFSNNNLADHHATVIAQQLLPHNSSLECIDLRFNSITDTGALSLVSVLQSHRNENLIELLLSGNKVSTAVLQSLDTCLHNNRHDALRRQCVTDNNNNNMHSYEARKHMFQTMNEHQLQQELTDERQRNATLALQLGNLQHQCSSVERQLLQLTDSSVVDMEIANSKIHGLQLELTEQQHMVSVVSHELHVKVLALQQLEISSKTLDTQQTQQLSVLSVENNILKQQLLELKQLLTSDRSALQSTIDALQLAAITEQHALLLQKNESEIQQQKHTDKHNQHVSTLRREHDAQLQQLQSELSTSIDEKRAHEQTAIVLRQQLIDVQVKTQHELQGLRQQLQTQTEITKQHTMLVDQQQRIDTLIANDQKAQQQHEIIESQLQQQLAAAHDLNKQQHDALVTLQLERNTANHQCTQAQRAQQSAQTELARVQQAATHDHQLHATTLASMQQHMVEVEGEHDNVQQLLYASQQRCTQLESIQQRQQSTLRLVFKEFMVSEEAGNANH